MRVLKKTSKNLQKHKNQKTDKLESKQELLEKTKRKTVRSYYFRYWYLILAAFVLLVTEALCDLQLPDYMKNIVNTLTDLNAADKTRIYLQGLLLSDGRKRLEVLRIYRQLDAQIQH